MFRFSIIAALNITIIIVSIILVRCDNSMYGHDPDLYKYNHRNHHPHHYYQQQHHHHHHHHRDPRIVADDDFDGTRNHRSIEPLNMFGKYRYETDPNSEHAQQQAESESPMIIVKRHIRRTRTAILRKPQKFDKSNSELIRSQRSNEQLSQSPPAAEEDDARSTLMLSSVQHPISIDMDWRPDGGGADRTRWTPLIFAATPANNVSDNSNLRNVDNDNDNYDKIRNQRPTRYRTLPPKAASSSYYRRGNAGAGSSDRETASSNSVESLPESASYDSYDQNEMSQSETNSFDDDNYDDEPIGFANYDAAAANSPHFMPELSSPSSLSSSSVEDLYRGLPSQTTYSSTRQNLMRPHSSSQLSLDPAILAMLSSDQFMPPFLPPPPPPPPSSPQFDDMQPAAGLPIPPFGEDDTASAPLWDEDGFYGKKK